MLSNDNIHFKRLIEHMNEAVWIGDDNERTVYANPKFCELMEMSLEEMKGRESYDFWDPESAKTVRSTNQKHRKKGESSSYQGFLLSKSGKRIPVLLSGTPLPDGGTIGIMTDLTEIKKNEQKSLTLARAIEHSHDAVILLDNEGTILSWNAGAEKIFGYVASKMLGSSIQVLFSHTSWKQYFESHFLQTDLEMVHKNKNNIYIDATITRLDTTTNYSYIFIARDISQQVQIQKDMIARYEKMQAAYNEFGIIRRRMDYVFDLVEEANKKGQSMKNIADFIISSLIMLTRANASVLRIMKDDKLEYMASFGLSSEWTGKSFLSVKNSLAYKGFLKGENIKIFDISLSSEYSTKTLALKNNFSSLFVMPLSFRGEFFGSISLYIHSQKDFHIFEHPFLNQYKKVIEMTLGSILYAEKN